MKHSTLFPVKFRRHLLLSVVSGLFCSNLISSDTDESWRKQISLHSRQPQDQYFQDEIEHMQKHGHAANTEQKSLIKNLKDRVCLAQRLKAKICELQNQEANTADKSKLLSEITSLTEQLEQAEQRKARIVPRFELWPYMSGLSFTKIMSYILSDYERAAGSGLSENAKDMLAHETDFNIFFCPQSLADILSGDAFIPILPTVLQRAHKANIWECSQTFLSYCENKLFELVFNSYQLLLQSLKHHRGSNPIDGHYVYKDDSTRVIRCFVDKSSTQQAYEEHIYALDAFPVIREYWLNLDQQRRLDNPDERLGFFLTAVPDWNACDVIFQKVGDHWFLNSVCPSPAQIQEENFSAESLTPLLGEQGKLNECFGWNQAEINHFRVDFAQTCSNHFWAFLMHFDFVLSQDPKTEDVMQQIFPNYRPTEVKVSDKDTQRRSKTRMSMKRETFAGNVFAQINNGLASGSRVEKGSFSWLTSFLICPWTYNAHVAQLCAQINHPWAHVSSKLTFFNNIKNYHKSNTAGGKRNIPPELAQQLLEVEDKLRQKNEELGKHETSAQEILQKRVELAQVTEEIQSSASQLARSLLKNEDELSAEAEANGWVRPPRSQITMVALDKNEIVPWMSQNLDIGEIVQVGNRLFYTTQTNHPIDAVHLDLFSNQLFLTTSNSVQKQAKISGAKLYSKQTYPIPNGPVTWVGKVDVK